MKGRKKIRAKRRLSALLLTLMLTVSMVSPASLKAGDMDSENPVQTQEDDKNQEGDKQNSGLNQEGGQNQEKKGAETSEEDSVKLGDNALGQDQMNQNETEQDVGSSSTDSTKTDVAENLGEDVQKSGQPFANETGFDVTSPVIESFEFTENKKTVGPEESLHFTVRAYDAQSSLDRVSVEFHEKDTSASTDWHQADLVKSAKDDKLYTAEYPVKGLYGTDYVISRVRAVDKNSNYADAKVNDDSYNPIYTFKINRTSTTGPEIKNIQMTNQGMTLRDGGTVKVSAEVTAENGLEDEYSTVRACFTTVRGNGTHNSWQTLDKDTGNTYKTTFKITGTIYPGRWELTSVEATDKKGYVGRIKPEDLYFNVEQDDFDTVPPVIKKITLDKQGQILSPGDSVAVTVEAEDDVDLEESAYIYFQAAADNVADDYRSVDLTYDREAKAYKGVFEVHENTYPCEWYVNILTIRDTSGNEADLQSYGRGYSLRYPDYFRVINQGTSVEKTGKATVVFDVTDQNGRRRELLRKEKEVSRRETLGNIVGEFPDASALETYKGIKFKGWVDSSGNPLDENTEILTTASGGRYSIYASYDKNPIQLNYSYLGDEGFQNGFTEVLLADEGATYGEAIEQAEKRGKPDSAYEEMKFTGWKCMYYSGNKDIPIPPGTSLTLYAQYEKVLANINLRYVDAKGDLVYDSVQKQYENGTKLKEVLKDLDKEGPPESYDGLKFTGWKCTEDLNQEIGNFQYISMEAVYEGKTVVQSNYSYPDQEGKDQNLTAITILDSDKVDTAKILEKAEAQEAPESFKGLRFLGWKGYLNGTAADPMIKVNLQAQYENCLYSVILDDWFRNPSGGNQTQDYEYMDVRVVEKNSNVQIPSSVKGYKSVTWVNSDYYTDDVTKPFTVKGNITLYGYGDKSDAPGPDPGPTPDPDPTPDPGPAPTPPGISLPEEEVIQHITEIRDVQPGGQVVIPMTNNATVVPVEILEAAKGQDVNVVLQMNGYSWTINGRDVLGSNLTDINLEVKLDENVIPSDLIKRLAGGKPVRQLSLTHDGDFGFKADLNINLGSQYAGQYGNLYYYDSSGKMVFMNAGEISADGSASLGFSHASDYAVVIGEYMGNSVLEVSLGQSGGTTGLGSPRTGDHVPLIPLAVTVVGALAVIAFSLRKKYCK